MPPVVDSSGFLHPADALGGTGPAAGGRRGGPRRSLLALDSEAKKSTLEERAGRLQTFAIEVLQSYLGSNVNTEDWTREGKAFAPEVRAFEGIRDGYFSNLFLTRQHLEAYIPRTTAAALSSTHSIPVALVWSNRATFLQRIFAAHPPANQPNDADSQTSQNEEQWSEQSRSERLDYFVEALDGFGRVVPWKEWRDGDDRVLSILGSMKAQYYILSLQSGTNQPLEAVFESKLADNFQPPDESDRKRYKRNPTKERKTEAKYNQICKEWMQKLEQARGNADQLMHLFPYHEMAQEVLFYMNDLCHTDLDLLLDNAPTVPSAALAEAEAEGGDLDIAAVLPALDAAASQDFLRDLNVSLQGMQRSEVENSAQRFRDGETPASSQFEYSREPVGSGDVLHRDGNFYGSPNVGTQMTPVNSQLLADEAYFWEHQQHDMGGGEPAANSTPMPDAVDKIRFNKEGGLDRVVGTAKGKGRSMMDRQQDAVRLTNFESQSQPQGTPSIEFRRGSTYNEEVIDPNLRVNDPAHADDIPVNPLEFEDADGERHVYGNEYEHAGDLGVGAFPAFDADASLEGAFMGDSQPPSTPMMHPPAQIIGQKRPAPHSSGPFLEESTDDEASRTKPSKKKKYRTTNKRPNRGKPKARELPPVDDPPSDGEPNAPVRPEKYDSAFNKYRLDRNGPVQRRFWAPGGPEEQLLIQCLNRYGALARPWHEILKRWGKDGTKGDLFKDQNNVSLKDHARSIKNRYLREGLPMPPGLDKWVTAKKTLRALEEERRAAEERRRLEGREGEDGGEGSQMPESQLGDYQELSQTHSLA